MTIKPSQPYLVFYHLSRQGRCTQLFALLPPGFYIVEIEIVEIGGIILLPLLLGLLLSCPLALLPLTDFLPLAYPFVRREIPPTVHTSLSQ